jgi:hypothetical protein
MTAIVENLQGLEHHVESDEAVLWVIESLGHSGENLEPQRLPQPHRCGVGLDYRVELHAVKSGRARPLDGVLTERAPDPRP